MPDCTYFIQKRERIDNPMKYAGGIQAPGGPHSGDTSTKLLLFCFLLRLLLGLLLGCH